MVKNFFEKTPLFPFLTAIYPVAYLVSVNIDEVERLAGLRTVLIFLIICAFSFLSFYAFTHSSQRSASYTLIIVVLFFLIFFVIYAPLYRALREIPGIGHSLGRHRYLILLTLLIMVTAAILLLKFGKKISSRKINNINFFANLSITFLFLMPILTIIISLTRNKIISNISINSLPKIDPLEISSLNSPPDIYFIVLDMNTNENVLRKLLEYDDSDFTKALEARGFYVSPCSQSNYDKTIRSLASTLNMDYLQSLELPPVENAYFSLIQYSKVQRMLENAGYKTYSFETDYWVTELKYLENYLSRNDNLVNVLLYPGVTAFEGLVLDISAGQLLYENRDSLSKSLQVIIDAPYVKERETILYTLETLPKISNYESPKFVFAHLMTPHDPFVFNRDGDPAYRRTPYTNSNDPEFGVGYGWDSYKKAYVDEVFYIHKRIIDLIDEILEQSKRPPVIIIQGDHGIPQLESAKSVSNRTAIPEQIAQ